MTEQDTPTPSRPAFLRWLPVLVLVAGAALFFALGWHRYLSFDALRDNRELLQGWVHDHWVLAVAAFTLAYALAVVFVPPSGTVMTVGGGFVFGWLVATVTVVIGATVGATILFLAARLSFGDALRARCGGAIRRMEDGFRENAMSYMLVLRLVPLFPFWLVNIAPAFLGVGLRTYVIGTVIGIIPGTAVYAIFGSGLGSILDAGGDISLAGVLTPEIIAALVGLAVLALVPVIYKKVKAGRG
ncbi:MAG: TVP38/TMEM64 family protein [Rhodobacterales bacterium]|nr:TVP38/TMEM64 family protein [Rhodobacterales bacterium]